VVDHGVCRVLKRRLDGEAVARWKGSLWRRIENVLPCIGKAIVRFEEGCGVVAVDGRCRRGRLCMLYQKVRGKPKASCDFTSAPLNLAGCLLGQLGSSNGRHLKSFLYPPQVTARFAHCWQVGFVSSHFRRLFLQVMHPT
jgi:hypothetical protein